MEGFLASYTIVPYDASFEARYEVKFLLSELSDEFPKIDEIEVIVAPSGFNGLILADLRDYVSGREMGFKERLKSKILEKFEEMRRRGDIKYVKKLVVFDFIVNTDVEKIAKAIKNYRDLIDDTWRITLRSRGIIKDKSSFIRRVAEPIDKPVDLKDPKYIIHIEVLGELTGIYLEKRK